MSGLGTVGTLTALAALLTAAGTAGGVILSALSKRRVDRSGDAAARSAAQAEELALLLAERRNDTSDLRGDVDRLEARITAMTEQIDDLRLQLWHTQKQNATYVQQIITAGLHPTILPVPGENP